MALLPRPRFILAAILVLHMTTTYARRISKYGKNTDAAFYCIAKDAILDEPAIFKNVTNGLVDCIDFCVEVAICKAINTHKRTDGKLDCHLLQEDHMSKGNKVISKSGWKLYDTGSSATNKAIGPKCASKAVNPCAEHCSCVDTKDGHRCDCGEKETFLSCKTALHENHMAELHYWIKNAHMPKAVFVKCTKSQDGFYKSTFDHSQEQRTYVSGYEARGSYKKSLSYSPNTILDIMKYIDTVAAGCKQFTKTECRGAMTHYGNISYPLSNKGIALNYWGGGPQDGSGGCACGITKTCRYVSRKCNCDANLDSYAAVDQGYITDKNVLPLSEVRFGDTGASSEYLYYTIGKLACTEKGEKKTFPSCKEALQENHMAELHYWIKSTDMTGAIYVKCGKTQDGFYTSTFNHSQEHRTYVSGYEAPGSYKKSLSYSPNTILDIMKYIDTVAAGCKQFTKTECTGALTHYLNTSYPLSNKGVALNYWGGGPQDGNGGCACGITKTCKNTAYKCNCDANLADYVAVDKGYITDKNVLPLSEVRFGDTGASSEYLYYTIGKLVCTEKGEKKTFPSCKAALQENHMAELHYWIKSTDMTGAIYVKCGKTQDGFYTSTFNHSEEQRTYVSGYEAPGSYKKSLSYSPNTVLDIMKYIDTVAAGCKQFTKTECTGAMTHRGNKSYPLSNKGVALNYWGGGPQDGSGGCACGITNTCKNTAYKCNCDNNLEDYVAVDQGYITDKNVLPLSEVRFGDTGASSEYLYYTIGKLVCTEI